MILGLAWIGLAAAEVPALRGQGCTVDLGQDALSAAAPLGEGPRLGLAVHPAGFSPELQVGWTLPVGAARGRWRGEALLAAGALAPWKDPGLTLTGTAGLRSVWEGERLGWEGRALAPLAVGVLPHRVLRAPLHLETALRARIGPVWLGGRASLGASWVSGGAATVDAALGLTVDLARRAPQDPSALVSCVTP